MNTLSSTLLNPPTSDNIIAARQWSLRSASLVNQASDGLDNDAPRDTKVLCGRARVIAEFNLGALAEVSRTSDTVVFS
jgi:hypothetical protein